MVKRLSESTISSLANEVWNDFCRKSSQPRGYPIPVHSLARDVFDADIDWEPLGAAEGGELVLGKLRAPSFGHHPEIILNLDLIDTVFRKSEHLANTVVAHELGHLLLHVPSGKQLQLEMDMGPSVEFEVRFSNLDLLLGESIDRTNDWWREWQANTFARQLLIPILELERRVGRNHSMQWPQIYELADDFKVTPSMMRIQLTKLGALVPSSSVKLPSWNRSLRI